QRRSGLLERLGRLDDVLLEPLVLHDDLGGRLAVVEATVRAASVLQGVEHVRTQLFVLDEPLQVRVAPHPFGGGSRLLGLALRHPAPPWVVCVVLSAILYPGLRCRTRPALPRGARRTAVRGRRLERGVE